MPSPTLTGKIAIVTGSSEIGAAIVRELSARGASTVVNYPVASLQAEADALVTSAKELPPKYGCTVNTVSPGPTQTEGFSAAEPEQMRIPQPVIDQTPVGPRMARAEEIAYAVAILCEDEARWINGAHLVASGGLFVD
ncbi:hypothetical protein BDW74DRAFT_175307 [Aspergillus multicolor]|uniref:uncharacterized protein n=1 Tax=Aspergillus multicolor TaxID=41759 RepID=UPI003CCCEAFC